MNPTVDDVLAEIRRIARDELELTTDVEPQHALLSDLALDSMAITIVAVALEDKYRIVLCEEDARAETVLDLARLVVRRAQEEARS